MGLFGGLKSIFKGKNMENAAVAAPQSENSAPKVGWVERASNAVKSAVNSTISGISKVVDGVRSGINNKINQILGQVSPLPQLASESKSPVEKSIRQTAVQIAELIPPKIHPGNIINPMAADAGVIPDSSTSDGIEEFKYREQTPTGRINIPENQKLKEDPFVTEDLPSLAEPIVRAPLRGEVMGERKKLESLILKLGKRGEDFIFNQEKQIEFSDEFCQRLLADQEFKTDFNTANLNSTAGLFSIYLQNEVNPNEQIVLKFKVYQSKKITEKEPQASKKRSIVGKAVNAFSTIDNIAISPDLKYTLLYTGLLNMEGVNILTHGMTNTVSISKNLDSVMSLFMSNGVKANVDPQSKLPVFSLGSVDFKLQINEKAITDFIYTVLTTGTGITINENKALVPPPNSPNIVVSNIEKCFREFGFDIKVKSDIYDSINERLIFEGGSLISPVIINVHNPQTRRDLSTDQQEKLRKSILAFIANNSLKPLRIEEREFLDAIILNKKIPDGTPMSSVRSSILTELSIRRKEIDSVHQPPIQEALQVSEIIRGLEQNLEQELANKHFPVEIQSICEKFAWQFLNKLGKYALEEELAQMINRQINALKGINQIVKKDLISIFKQKIDPLVTNRKNTMPMLERERSEVLIKNLNLLQDAKAAELELQKTVEERKIQTDILIFKFREHLSSSKNERPLMFRVISKFVTDYLTINPERIIPNMTKIVFRSMHGLNIELNERDISQIKELIQSMYFKTPQSSNKK